MAWDDSKTDSVDKVLAADWNNMVTDQKTRITASSSDTLTNKSIDGDDNTVTDLPYTAIKSTARSGSDATLITGTKGTTGQAGQWDANGDLIALEIADVTRTLILTAGGG